MRDGRRVLVVEDDPMSRKLLRDLLGVAGFEVVEAENGEEALAAVRELRPGLVLMDVQMPVMDGLSATRALRADPATRETPVWAVTALAMPEDEAEVRAAGCDAFVSKPVDTAGLLRKVRMHFAGRAEVRAAPEAPPSPEPIVPAAASAEGAARPVAPLVMVVDDEAARRHLVRGCLEVQGYRVVEAVDGLQALQVARAERLDVIVLDLILPGPDGLEVCRLLKADGRTAAVPVLVLSAAGDRSGRIEGIRAGADDFVSKPIDAEELLLRVRNAARTKGLHDGLLGRTKELERAAAELSRASAELEAFTYSVSHDLRAPLRTVEGYVAVLDEDHGRGMPPEARRMLVTIALQVRQMSRMIDDLRRLSSVGRAELRRQRIDMRAAALAAWEYLESADGGGHPELAVAPLPPVFGDQALIQQVWMNLLDNARKFSGKAERPRVEVRAAEAGGEVTYSVADNGAGFEAEQAARLFRLFQRLHAVREFPGTGVGLAMVKRIVERHGGRVSAVGARGQGATFSFTLPSAGG